MKVIHLDQNQWVKLAQGRKFPSQYNDAYLVLNDLELLVASNRLLLPLTASNIYETFEINNISRRTDIARIQADLSRGYVFRGRKYRTVMEIANFLSNKSEITEYTPGKSVMSGIFTEAFSEYDDVSWSADTSDRRLDAIGTDPGNLLLDFLLKSNEKTRKSAVSAWSQLALFLLKKIEPRRSRFKNQALSIRRNVYSACMLIDEINDVLYTAKRLGLDWTSVSDIGPSMARDII